MPRALLVAALLSFCCSLHADNLSHLRDDLTQFNSLAQRCSASLRATSNQTAYDRFKAIDKIRGHYSHELTNLDVLDEESLQAMHNDCFAALQGGLLTRNPELALNQAHLQTFEISGAAERNQLTFDVALDAFVTEHQKELLTATTTKQAMQRFLLHFCVEMAAEFSGKLAKKRYGAQRSDNLRPYPTIQQRLTSLPKNSEQWKLYSLLITIASSRVGAYCAIDELIPKGISTYKQRLIELVGPILAATLLLQIIGKGDFGGGCLKAFTRLMMTRALFDKKHALYAPLNSAAYLLPFFMGVGRMVIRKGYPINQSMLPNMLIDGVSSMLIYDLLPKGVDKATPRNIPLNPANRRKAIKTFPREIVAKFNEIMSTIAYANA